MAAGPAAEAWQAKRGLWICRACERQTSITAQTIFAGTRTPLSAGFAAIWQPVSAKQGMSALQLQRIMGLGSYETAWAHLHKLRRAMVRPGRDVLSVLVEVDEATSMGAGPPPRPTAGWRRSATPTSRSTSRSDEPASTSMPHVHRVFALLKRWLLGTHQGSVQPHQLDYHLDEFTFRVNRRPSRHVGPRFYRLLQEAAAIEPVPLSRSNERALTGGRAFDGQLLDGRTVSAPRSCEMSRTSSVPLARRDTIMALS